MDWSELLQAVYPKRSGPCGWRGMRLMLACRRALFESTWEQIIDGCKNYKAYCQASGREGSDFVQAPQRFIEDGSFLEEFTYQAAEDPRIAEQKGREAARRRNVEQAATAAGIGFDSRDSTASIETRILLSKTNSRATQESSDSVGNPQLAHSVASLAGRMRITK